MSRNQTANLYEKDFHKWAWEQARRLRAGEDIDRENVAEELEDLGKSQQQQLENRLAVLLAHLLKWEYQPDKRSRSWEGTIKEQRKRIEKHLHKNPSLKAELAETISSAYDIAVTFASVETGIIEEDFPMPCPYSIEQILIEPAPSTVTNTRPKKHRGQRTK
jgi:hypothetical protein